MIDNSILNNQIYGDWPLHYDPLLPESHFTPFGKITLDTGMNILPNGDVQFRVNAPKASSVRIETGDRNNQKVVELTKGESGIFSGILPFDPAFAGPHSLDILIDGACFLSPVFPISWHRNRPVNYIDIPDTQTPYILVRDVPHGSICRELYWSKVMHRWQRCMVYTPPGYMKNNESYPVLYLQHGATENEITWEYNGRVSSILDNLTADGLIQPFIVVMNDGMVAYEGSFHGSAFGDMLLKDCIPYIEKTYRVKTDKWSRALAGLSMGSMQTSMIGMAHPEWFGYLGLFSGFMRNIMIENPNSHLAILQDKPKFAESYRVFFRSMGDADQCVATFYEDDEICASSGIDRLPNYHRVMYPGQYHEFGAWRRALYDFAQLIFR